MSEATTPAERSELRSAYSLLKIEFEERFRISADDNADAVDFWIKAGPAGVARFIAAYMKRRGDEA